jgi:hypothetical protein
MSLYFTRQGLPALRREPRIVTMRSGFSYLKRSTGWAVSDGAELRAATSAETRFLNARYGRVEATRDPAPTAADHTGRWAEPRFAG